MLRPEVVKQLKSPAMSLASSWVISRKNLTSNNLVAVRDAFKRDYWPFAKEKVEKSNPKATQLREQGNAAYKKAPDEPDRALGLYNQSICMAEEDSEELGMGYANRSAIYFNRKMYRECLQNIRLAKRHHYPERMMAKLKEREERCLKMMANSPESSRKDEKGGKHCSMQSCLEMSDDSRGICTSRDLSVGEKVLLEKPFLLVLEPELAYQRCDYCGLRNGLNLRPCKTCTSVMYCSEDCQEQALQRYHQFECEVVDDLTPLFRGPKPVRLLYLSLRLFWHGVLLYLEDPETFSERCKNRAALAQYRNPFTLEPSDYFYHLFLEGLENLSHKQHSRDVNDLTDRCVREFASVLMYVVAVEENTSLALRLEGKPGNETLRDMLFVLVYQAERLADHRAPEMTCLYPFSRLLRHSCAPTAERFLHDLQSVIVLKRPVSKGQEITIAYSEKLNTDRMIKEKRQAECKKEHCITECNCEGCVADYPLLEKIEKDENLSTQLQTIRAEPDETFQRDRLVEFLQRNNHLYPKQELAEAWNMYRRFVLNDM